MRLLSVFLVSLVLCCPALAQDSKQKWVPSNAYIIPKETAPEGEGYFAIVEGKNGRLYIGTHANAVNSWLVEFDPKSKQMEIVVDAHKAIGTDLKGFGAQSKIHTRNNVGKSGKIYFATKQGYPAKGESRKAYPGGYPMVYDPKTGKTKVYPIPVPHHGIISITPDEERGVAYLSTCSDDRPFDRAFFVILDLKTGKSRSLLDTEHMYAFIVVDRLGRAYHPLRGGKIARYDPRSDKLEKLTQTIDGKPPTADSHLADENGHPINWDISPDGKTLFCVPMSTNMLYSYDLTGEGKTLVGKSLGKLIPDAEKTDCRALCVGPSGTVWASVTKKQKGYHESHIVSYRAGTKAPRDHGPVAITNPKYTDFTDKDGKTLKFHHGVFKTPEGVTTTKYVTMGVCEGRDGAVYVLTIIPYTLLRIEKEALR